MVFFFNSVVVISSSNMRKVKRCCVPGCQDISAPRHRLPVYDPPRFNIWKKRIAQPKFDSVSIDYIYKSYKICRSHFSKDCFSPGTIRLNANAVPTLNLPGGNSIAHMPLESSCIEETNSQSLFVQDTEHENHSEGIIKFVVTSAQQQLSDRNTRMLSHVQYINSLPWKVMLQRKDSYFGIFLCLHSTEYDPNYKVYAEFSFRLVDQKNFSNSVVETGHHEFRKGGTGHGFPYFTHIHKLLNPSGNFLREDTFIIECHVACSSLLQVIDVSSCKDDAIKTFMQVNDIPVDYLADRAKYILENGVGSDCEFVINGLLKRKRVCKAILARASPVFESMFYVYGKERDVYRVSDISSSVFDVVLQHIYGTRWEFQSKHQAIELYYAACKYELKDLQVMCIRFIWPTTLDDAWIALEFAMRYKLEDLQEAAMKILRKNTCEVFAAEWFVNISLRCLVLILKQTNLTINSEIDVFNAACRWANAQCKKKDLASIGINLRSELGEAIRHIRFLTMSAKEFVGGPCESGVLTKKEKADIVQRLTTKKTEPLLSELSGITSPRQV